MGILSPANPGSNHVPASSVHLGIDVVRSAGDVIEGVGQGGDPLAGESWIEPRACVQRPQLLDRLAQDRPVAVGGAI